MIKLKRLKSSKNWVLNERKKEMNGLKVFISMFIFQPNDLRYNQLKVYVQCTYVHMYFKQLIVYVHMYTVIFEFKSLFSPLLNDHAWLI